MTDLPSGTTQVKVISAGGHVDLEQAVNAFLVDLTGEVLSVTFDVPYSSPESLTTYGNPVHHLAWIVYRHP